jgi:hypothetical protein
MSIDQKIKNLRAALADLGQDTRQWTDEDLVSRILSGGPSRLPAWADRSADGRVESLRAEYAREGLDVTGLSDTAVLGIELNRAWAEARRHENAYTSLLQTQVQEHRAVRTASHRAAVQDVTAQAGLYLQAILRQQAQPIDGVIYRAEQIPEDGRMPVQAARELRSAALQARWLLSGLSSTSALAEAGKDEDVQALEALKAELRRMQEAVMSAGRALHATYGQTAGRLCECPGCELIREVHDHGSDSGVAGGEASEDGGA